MIDTKNFQPTQQLNKILDSNLHDIFADAIFTNNLPENLTASNYVLIFPSQFNTNDYASGQYNSITVNFKIHFYIQTSVDEVNLALRLADIFQLNDYQVNQTLFTADNLELNQRKDLYFNIKRTYY